MDPTEVIFSLLTLAFLAWAGVVGWMGRMVGRKLDRIVDRLDNEAEKLNEYIIQTEARLAVLESKVNGGNKNG